MESVNGHEFDQDTEEQVIERSVEKCPTCRSANEVMDGDSVFVACSECIDGFNNTVTVKTESDSMSSRSLIEGGLVAMAIASLKNRNNYLNGPVGDNGDNGDDDEDDSDDDVDWNDHEDGQVLGDDEENIGEEENSDSETDYIDVDGNITDDDGDDNNHNHLYYGKYEDIILVFGPDSSRG